MNLTTIPQFQDFNIEGIRHISPTDAYSAIRRGEAFLLDVREPNETMLETVKMPDVIYHPMSVILDRIANIPTEKMVITACPGGVRSLKVANLLVGQGFTNVVNLDGGLKTWIAMGLPFGRNALFGCGCKSQPVVPEIKQIWKVTPVSDTKKQE